MRDSYLLHCVWAWFTVSLITVFLHPDFFLSLAIFLPTNCFLALSGINNQLLVAISAILYKLAGVSTDDAGLLLPPAPHPRLIRYQLMRPIDFQRFLWYPRSFTMYIEFSLDIGSRRAVLLVVMEKMGRAERNKVHCIVWNLFFFNFVKITIRLSCSQWPGVMYAGLKELCH